TPWGSRRCLEKFRKLMILNNSGGGGGARYRTLANAIPSPPLSTARTPNGDTWTRDFAAPSRIILQLETTLTTTRPATDPASQAERLFEGFENLMPFRVNDILL